MRILINWLAALTSDKWIRNRNLFLSWTMQSAAKYIKKWVSLIKGLIYDEVTHMEPLLQILINFNHSMDKLSHPL